MKPRTLRLLAIAIMIGCVPVVVYAPFAWIMPAVGIEFAAFVAAILIEARIP
jgi:hypothetical protein